MRNLILDSLVAAGTLGAVLVALFGQAFRSKFFPPILTLELADPHGHRTPVTDIPPPESGQDVRTEQALYFHVRVSNARRWSPATQVRVDLLQVEEPGPDGAFQIVWTGDVPLIWRHQHLYPPARTVGPEALADLCSVVKGKWLELHTQLTPHSLQTKKKDSANLLVTLRARSTECDSNVLAVRISWDGGWHDGVTEMQRHLTVKRVEAKDVARAV